MKISWFAKQWGPKIPPAPSLWRPELPFRCLNWTHSWFIAVQVRRTWSKHCNTADLIWSPLFALCTNTELTDDFFLHRVVHCSINKCTAQISLKKSLLLALCLYTELTVALHTYLSARVLNASYGTWQPGACIHNSSAKAALSTYSHQMAFYERSEWHTFMNGAVCHLVLKPLSALCLYMESIENCKCSTDSVPFLLLLLWMSCVLIHYSKSLESGMTGLVYSFWWFYMDFNGTNCILQKNHKTSLIFTCKCMNIE